jgi:ketosteroid isomerase-like protein
MYHRIVRSRVRQAYAKMSAGRYRDVVRTFSPDIVFRFYGDHAMGGEQRGSEAVRAWFERVFRLLPGLRLEPLSIVVDGPPWNTTVATRFRVHAELPDGLVYTNEGMQYLRLRWGKAVEDRLYEDTQVLSEAIERQRAALAKAPAGVPSA